MTRNALLLAALLALIGGYTWYDNNAHQTPEAVSEAPKAKIAQPAPNFDFRALDGKTHSLSDFEGKVIVLNFWASWCAPCVVEFPQMLKLAQSVKEDSVFLFLSLDEDEAAVKKFIKKYGKDLPRQNVFVALDTDKTVSQSLYQTYKLPETYIIGPDLNIAGKIIGADVAWDSDDMREKLRTIAKN